MKERPILFSGLMVLALLAGTKTQTRRAVKSFKHYFEAFDEEMDCIKDKDGLPSRLDIAPDNWECCPYGVPGDRLWVRETHIAHEVGHVQYRADYVSDPVGEKAHGIVWTPSIHMYRWASRILLEVVAVRVERLQDITEADAKAEGCTAEPHGTWWQGYRDCGGTIGLNHEQFKGDSPPDWMIEPHKDIPRPWLDRTARSKYELLWDQINGPGSWSANPWVWVLEFNRVLD